MPAVTALVTLAETRTHLNFGAGDTSHDTELEGFIDAATPVIEDLAGAVVGATWTNEEHIGVAGQVVYLRHVPVYSVTTLVEYRSGAAATLTGVATAALGSTVNSYSVDLDTGRVIRSDGCGQIVVATYVSGRAAVPSNVRLATLELVRHLYQLTQQGGRPAFGGATEDGPWMPSGFAVPTRVMELLASTPNLARPLVR